MQNLEIDEFGDVHVSAESHTICGIIERERVQSAEGSQDAVGALPIVSAEMPEGGASRHRLKAKMEKARSRKISASSDHLPANDLMAPNGGRSSSDQQANLHQADPQPIPAVQILSESQRCKGSGSDEQVQDASRATPQPPQGLLIAQIQEQWRQRQDLHREEISLTLRMQAICRRIKGGDKKAALVLYEAMLDLFDPPRRAAKQDSDAQTALMCCKPFLQACEIIQYERLTKEKILKKAVGLLPVAKWWCSIKGANLGGLAALVGECGDIGRFKAKRTGKASVRALWRWCSLACFEDGSRQRFVQGKKALECGYSGRRRAVMWTIGLPVFMAQSRKGKLGSYRQIYDARKAAMLARRPDMKPMHLHKDAMRIMTKALLKDLWQEWRAHEGQ